MSNQEVQLSEKQNEPAETVELTREGLYFTPAVDIYETPNELVVLADMPGVRVEDLDIDLKDDTLSIIGKVPDPEQAECFLLNEYRTGSYFRSFRLTDAVDQGRISAALADGVLKLKLPKAAKAVPRKIPISGG